MVPELHSEKRRARRTPRAQPLEVCIGVLDDAGARQLIPACIVDASEAGLGIQLHQPLEPGAYVSLVAGSALLPSSDLRICPHAAVQWCRRASSGNFRAGLSYLQARAEPPAAGPAEEDHYEILQVNPKASPETIHRVYRLLAQQYHPDNGETGDEQLFRSVLAAYKVLSDPEQRAAYDQRHQAVRDSRWRIFRSAESVHGIRGERRRRFGVLRALYAKRLQDPRQPEMSVPELESLLGIPREHMEFTIWYLKERGYLVRSDNIRYSITAAGVEHTEALEEAAAGVPESAGRRQLPPAGQA